MFPTVSHACLPANVISIIPHMKNPSQIPRAAIEIIIFAEPAEMQTTY
jgi:hypothetical protein